MSATYRLTGRIEGGDLAELCEALQLPSGEVVVKLFHPKTSDPAYARDLAETSRLLSSVRHPGILHTVEMGFVKQRLAVVREDVAGFTLGTALQRLHTKEVVLPPAVALHIIIQLLEAVQQAHDAGVFHGALTPGNVILARDGTPAVSDFGALRALLAVPQLRKSFAHRGRSAYRAPEVARGEPVSEQSDIYSLGSIAYELLTQREAVIPGSGGVSTRRSEVLPPPSRLDRRLNSRLDPIIMRALEATPQRRFRSCREFAGALRNFLSASGGLPGAEDVRRFVSELFPNEVSLSTLGPAPFKETFTLEPISGAEMDDIHAEELEASVVQRAPYSRTPSEEESSAETQDSAAPAFEEYRPEDYAPAQEPSRVAAPRMPPVQEDENTNPSVAGPLEQGWEAPPGAAPVKPARKQLVPQGHVAGGEGFTRIGRNPRLKVVEDFSGGPLPPAEEEELSLSGRRPARPKARVRAAEQRVAPDAAHPTLETPVAEAPRERSDIAIPAPSEPSIPPVTPSAARRMLSQERRLVRTENRRWKLVAVAGAIALVGMFSFAIGAWQLGRKDARKPDAVPTSAEPPVAEVPPGPPPAVPIPRPSSQAPVSPPVVKAPPAPVTPHHAPPVETHAPPVDDERVVGVPLPPKSQRAFVTITTNTPARVYVDGKRVGQTPMSKLPVKMGEHFIQLVSIATGEKKDVSLRLARGQHHKVMVDSFRVPRR